MWSYYDKHSFPDNVVFITLNTISWQVSAYYDKHSFHIFS